ncbi:MAG: dTDP-4-dehydrorhamnose 3,5-epimerase [Candidatus Calescibacterium sp.]|nr:dTDP-4-dehydrorhamnose 3,5-epimerase [Candidatus Calescibacterium sp.]MCX7734998.1 dTDP-4-dehydrorhamnose 3,5-epimerase [bacterium]MDW8087808.1 dTDP-4-dehydrorhamnose 3,5-epimerase [Candidatus Calescibacterium sp.]
MRFLEVGLDGAFVIESEYSEDERGFFARVFCQKEFGSYGVESQVVQSNISFNRKKGTLRGMHYQAEPYQEAKLVCCVQGAIYDVIIDIRPESKTFKQWVAVLLSPYGTDIEKYRTILPKKCILARPGSFLYIPEGFAHGFQTLEDNTIIFYHMFEFYSPDASRGIRWNDPAFGILWPLEPTVISSRDKSYKDFESQT